MIETNSATLWRCVKERGVARAVRMLYPLRHDATPYVRGVRCRRSYTNLVAITPNDSEFRRPRRTFG